MDSYEPPSAFLKSVIDEDASLTGADSASNLRRRDCCRGLPFYVLLR